MSQEDYQEFVEKNNIDIKDLSEVEREALEKIRED